ncbi:TrmH family RNA methyltransferase [Desulforamulus reducens]|uniref:TrmH family RNA methyltransferase n=1 Tax=Desulforamulus reducens TaxID=59610 RepID=UPI001EE3F0F1|nr:RNA methyltransferase [Desulforamulus reducens]
MKLVKKLAQRNFRQKERKLAVEGIRFVEEALSSTWQTEILLYTDQACQAQRGKILLDLARDKGVEVLAVSDAIMKELSDTETPQGMLAVLRQPDYTLEDIIRPDQKPLVVIVDGVQDPGNLGTIIRSADAAGASGVILLKGTVDIYNPKTLRATMGSLFHLPVIQVSDVNEALEYLASIGVTLLVGEPAGGIPVFKANLQTPVGIIVANEGAGPREEIFRYNHQKITIPMPGCAESLNVAIATSIILYEAIRQRHKIQ